MTIRTINFDGKKIAYSFFSGHHKPKLTLVLLHNEFANRCWWNHLVEALRGIANVLAVDLSGAGDSEHRRRYSPAQHALEVSAAIDACALEGKVVLVAHGFAFHIAVQWARVARGASEVILVDPLPILPPRQYEIVPLLFRVFAKRKTFVDRRQAIADFKMRNTTFQVSDDLLNSIVDYSLIGKEGNWYWRGDSFHISKFAFPPESSMNLLTICSWTIPTGIIYGALSTTFSQAHLKASKTVLPMDRIVCIDEAGHHVFLDQPVQFVGALKKLTGQPEARSIA